ncbi:unnamed protein product [Trichobilharzia szidati]|nr:unnamed protein product [Trichobilharzia szidati]
MNSLSRIEAVVCEILQFLKSDESYQVKENYPVRILLKNPTEFTRFMVILKMMHEAVRENKFVTKRSIYYSNPILFKRQSTIDPIVSKICENFNLPRCALKISASPKLIIHGDIVLKAGVEDSSSRTNCMSITERIFQNETDINLTDIECTAQFILIIEKDTIFQKLLNENFYEKFKPCLLVTAKGYPDLLTRKFLAQLTHIYSRMPIIGIFDADPHGLNVYCTYKYGTMNPTMKDAKGNPVRIPNLQLCGLLPSEISSSIHIKETQLLSLTKNDKTLLETMQKREYIQHEPLLLKQIRHLLFTEKKAELEALNSINTRFLTHEYLPDKLLSLGILPNDYQ